MQNGACMHCHRIILYSSGAPSSLCWTCSSWAGSLFNSFFFVSHLHCPAFILDCFVRVPLGTNWDGVPSRRCMSRCCWSSALFCYLCCCSISACAGGKKKNNYRSWTGFVRAKSCRVLFVVYRSCIIMWNSATRRVISLSVYMRIWWWMRSMIWNFAFFYPALPFHTRMNDR